MLLGLVFLACKPVEKLDRAKSSMRTEAQKDLTQQRLLKDIQQQLNLNTLCFEREAKQKSSLFNSQLAKALFNNTENNLANQGF